MYEKGNYYQIAHLMLKQKTCTLTSWSLSHFEANVVEHKANTHLTHFQPRSANGTIVTAAFQRKYTDGPFNSACQFKFDKASFF